LPAVGILGAVNEEKPQYGLPRRIAAGLSGIGVLAFLTWNVLDGTIYLHGDGVSRVDHPVAFWLMAGSIAVAGLAAVYWAVFESRRDPKR